QTFNAALLGTLTPRLEIRKQLLAAGAGAFPEADEIASHLDQGGQQGVVSQYGFKLGALGIVERVIGPRQPAARAAQKIEVAVGIPSGAAGSQARQLVGGGLLEQIRVAGENLVTMRDDTLQGAQVNR